MSEKLGERAGQASAEAGTRLKLTSENRKEVRERIEALQPGDRLQVERAHPYPGPEALRLLNAAWEEMTEAEQELAEREFRATFPKKIVREAIGRHGR